MNYSVFWAKHINKVDTYELGLRVIIADELGKRLKKEVASAPAKVVSSAIDHALVKSKGMPIPKGVEVITERDEALRGYGIRCEVKVLGNKGWRNWFPLPIELRRQQFKAIDKMVLQLKLSIQKAIEPLCQGV